MSGGLVKLAKTAKQTFSKIQNDTRQAESAAGKYRNTLGYLYDRMNDLKRVRMDLGRKEAIAATNEIKKLKSEIDKIEGKSSGGGHDLLGGLAARLGPIALAAAAVTAAVSFAKASITQYADFEKSTRTYQVMTGNKGIGTSLSGELNNLKQNSILGTAVYPNAQMLMAMGDTPDKVIPHLKMLGDVSMGDADKLGRLTYAFGEVESAGKLNGRQLLQFINAGFNPLNEISKKTGKNMETLRQEMAKGKITFAEVEQAFESVTGKGGRFNDMMNQMADTTSGKMLMLKGKVAALEIAVGERLAPAFKWATDKTIGFVEWLKKLIEIPVETKLQDEINKIRALQAELTASNTSHQRQVDILKELNDINPNIVKGINEQNIEYGKLAKNIDAVTGALQKKIFMEQFTKDNADTLTNYASSQNQFNENFAKSLSIVGQAAPDLAARTDLTIGQKQMLTAQRLRAAIKSGNVHKVSRTISGGGMGYGSTTITSSIEEDFLLGLTKSLNEANRATDNISKLQPKVNEINQTKNSLAAQIDKTLGVKSMVASDIKNGGISGGVDGLKEGDDSISKGITGGGPRVININGVKFTDKVEIHAQTMNQGFEEAERKLEEMFLRILNSGASVQ